MMKLSKVAAYFNKTRFTSAYDPAVAFKGRLLAFDDNSRDSLSTERRIMSVVPGVIVPPRRVVAVGTDKWIVGNGTSDFHGDDVLHQKYVLHRADGIAQVATFAHALMGVWTQSMFAGRLWMKDLKEPEESSGLYHTYQLFVAATEDLRDTTRVGTAFDGTEYNVLVKMLGKWHLVRNVIDSAGGFQIAVVDELPEPVVVDAQFSTMTYNRLADKKVATTKVVKGINLRWQTNFTYLSEYSPKFVEGDCQLVVLKVDVTPSAGDEVSYLGRKFKVVAVIDQDPVLCLHLRHA